MLFSKKVQNFISKIKVSKKSVEKTLKNFDINPTDFSKIITDLEKCLHTFNEDLYDKSLYINAKHTFTIIGALLPSTQFVIDTLDRDDKVEIAVIDTLTNSDYFQEVWEITNPKYLYINIIILIYRTTLLTINKELSSKRAQISSTIEEMSLELKRKGIDNVIYDATKHWLENWEEEGFNKEIPNIIRSLNK